MLLGLSSEAQTSENLPTATVVIELEKSGGLSVTSDFTNVPIGYAERLDVILNHFENLAKDYKREDDFKEMLEKYLNKGATRL